VTNWAIEAGTPNVLFRRGFTKESLLPGTAISIDGYQSKDGSHRANGRDLTFADGKTLFLGSSGTGAPHELPPGAKQEPPRAANTARHRIRRDRNVSAGFLRMAGRNAVEHRSP